MSDPKATRRNLLKAAPVIALSVPAKASERSIARPPGTFEVSLFTDIAQLNIAQSIQRICTSGYREVGKGAAVLYRWNEDIHEALDVGGQGYWWAKAADGSKWFMAREYGTPEMIGAFADDDDHATGTDDGIFIEKAFSYFDVIEMPGRYYSGKTQNVYRPVRIFGLQGTEAAYSYRTTIRFPADRPGLIFHRRDTSGDDRGNLFVGKNDIGGADGFILSNLTIWCGDGSYEKYDGTNAENHGVWLKCRGLIDSIRVRGARGNGIHCYASAKSKNPLTRGNANGFLVRNCRVDRCSSSPIYIDGPDANAGKIEKLNARDCGSCYYDDSFLGNTHDSPQVAFCGKAGTRFYKGKVWYARDPEAAKTEEPGTGSAWYEGGKTVRPDNWTKGQPLLYGLSYRAVEANSRCTFINPYSEGGQGPADFGLQVVRVGGLLAAGYENAGIDLYAGKIGATRGYTGSHIQLAGSDSSVFTACSMQNDASINKRRGVALEFNIDFEADGGAPHKVAQLAGFGGSSISRTGSIAASIWNPTAATYDTKFVVADETIRPGEDNSTTAGTASYRFSAVFAGTGTINTSDEREKENITAIKDAVLDAWEEVGFYAFQFSDAVSNKGGNRARFHFGLLAQRVRDIFAGHGLDGMRFGLLCYDEWEAETDDEGNLIREAGSRWGIRYEEALALEAACQRRRADRLEARIAALEA